MQTLLQSENTLKTKACKIRIYPSSETQEYFLDCFKTAHTAWNYLVARNQEDYHQYKAAEQFGYLDIFSNTDFGKYFTELKYKGYFPDEFDSRIKNYLQQDMRRSKFISKGLPQFKSWKRRSSYSYTTGQAVSVKDNYLKIPKCKPIRFRGRVLSGDLKSVTVSYKNNKFYASLTYNNVDTQQLPKTNDVLALDWGERSFIYGYDSNGLVEKTNPPLFRSLHNKKENLQNILSKFEKDSNNYIRMKDKIAKLQEHIVNKTNDWFHKHTLDLVRRYDDIIIEKLNYKGLHQQAKRGVSKIKKLQWKFGYWKELISYKLDWYKSTKLIEVPAYNTSKTCFNCGIINVDLRSEEYWTCSSCGTKHHRDINAAKNIMDLGTIRLEENGKGVVSNGKFHYDNTNLCL